MATTVATEFAASWKPLVKSKSSANATTAITVTSRTSTDRSPVVRGRGLLIATAIAESATAVARSIYAGALAAEQRPKSHGPASRVGTPGDKVALSGWHVMIVCSGRVGAAGWRRAGSMTGTPAGLVSGRRSCWRPRTARERTRSPSGSGCPGRRPRPESAQERGLPPATDLHPTVSTSSSSLRRLERELAALTEPATAGSLRRYVARRGEPLLPSGE